MCLVACRDDFEKENHQDLMVPGRELESPHLAIHGPEPCASTNSATRASLKVYHYTAWRIAGRLKYLSGILPDSLVNKSDFA